MNLQIEQLTILRFILENNSFNAIRLEMDVLTESLSNRALFNKLIDRLVSNYTQQNSASQCVMLNCHTSNSFSSHLPFNDSIVIQIGVKRSAS